MVIPNNSEPNTRKAILAIQQLIKIAQLLDPSILYVPCSILEAKLANSHYQKYIHEALMGHPEYRFQINSMEQNHKIFNSSIVCKTLNRDTSLYIEPDNIVNPKFLNCLTNKLTDSKTESFRQDQVSIDWKVPIYDDIIQFIYQDEEYNNLIGSDEESIFSKYMTMD